MIGIFAKWICSANINRGQGELNINNMDDRAITVLPDAEEATVNVPVEPFTPEEPGAEEPIGETTGDAPEEQGPGESSEEEVLETTETPEVG